MASGDTLAVFHAASDAPPATDAATLDTRNQHWVLEYDDTTLEGAIFPFVMPDHYAAGGIDVTYVWLSDTVAGGTEGVVWGGTFERHEDDVDDLDADQYGTEVDTAETDPASLSGEPKYVTKAHVQGAETADIVKNESGRFRVQRKVADANDTMSGDAQLLRVILRET